MDSVTIHPRGYTTPQDCESKGHRFRRLDLKVCVRCGFYDQRYPISTRLIVDDYPANP